MVDVIAERRFDPPLRQEDVLVMSLEAGGCFRLHKIHWQQSLLALDGSKLVCHFTAPDLESVRIAFRQNDADASCLWSGTVHVGPDASPANVVVERSFDKPVSLEDIQAREDASAWCLEIRDVSFTRTLFSLDRRRMLCLYRAPDAEAVRQAQREADMPVECVWACRPVGPGDLPPS